MRLQVVSGSNALALTGPMTFPTVITEWQTYLAARGAVQTTIDKWPLVIGRLERHAGKDALTMTPRDILKYLSRPIAPASRRNYQAVISHFFDFAHKHGHIDANPTALLPTAKVPRRLPRPISETNLHTLMQAAGERTRDMIVLSAYAGFRVHEVAKMRTRHVEFDADELFVSGKGGTEVWLPLHPLIREAALRHMGDDYWFPNPQRNVHGAKWEAHLTANSVSGLIHKLMRSCGVPGTPHALRHRYATQLLEAGVDVRVVQELMRHSSLQTTALYTAVSDRRRRAAIDLLG